MNWKLEQREVEISARELAAFSLCPESLTPFRDLKERAEIGTLWHNTIREKVEKNPKVKSRFEIAVNGILYQSNWRFKIRGRIDQLLQQNNEFLLREVKTIRLELPCDDQQLRGLYSEYFHQAVIYELLAYEENIFKNNTLRSELLFVDYNEGITQSVQINDQDKEAFQAHLLEIASFLEDKRQRLFSLRNFSFGHPFKSWRPGQKETRDKLKAKLEDSKRILFQAPTGFGKTGLALEVALSKLKGGEVSKILFLTSKTTGQIPIQQQLIQMGAKESKLRFFTLHNRELLDANFQSELNYREQQEKWKAQGLSVDELFKDATVSLDDLHQLGKKTGIQPSSISKFLLPHSEIWIGDFNYLFDLNVRNAFHDFSGIHPEETFLIIDEAHNLPSRVAHSFSWKIDITELSRILTEIQLLRFPGNLIKGFDLLLTQLKSYSPCDELPFSDKEDFIESLKSIYEAWNNCYANKDELSPESTDFLRQLDSKIKSLTTNIPFLTHFPKKGCIQHDCLDCSEWIAEVVQPFWKSIFMSATLHPINSFKEKIGSYSDDFDQLIVRAPWQENSFQVLTDLRVDTRYRNREKYYFKTAQTILKIQEKRPGGFAVFFPSFKYATIIKKLIFSLDPFVKIFSQPRNRTTENLDSLIEEAVAYHDVLFFILGSRFSESIDNLGGKVNFALVVGPALPEVNAIQKAKLETYTRDRNVGFFEVYLIPAMQKINQALGRLVRSPEHSATIILQCKRFADPQLIDLLNPDCQPESSIKTDMDFDNWLKNLDSN